MLAAVPAPPLTLALPRSFLVLTETLVFPATMSLVSENRIVAPTTLTHNLFMRLRELASAEHDAKIVVAG